MSITDLYLCKFRVATPGVADLLGARYVEESSGLDWLAEQFSGPTSLISGAPEVTSVARVVAEGAGTTENLYSLVSGVVSRHFLSVWKFLNYPSAV